MACSPNRESHQPSELPAVSHCSCGVSLTSRILMIGPSLTAPGGMSAVVKSYEAAGLFDARGIRYISSYERPGLQTQVRVMLPALFEFARALLVENVELVHVHSASRGSFWRKALFCRLAVWAGKPFVFHIHSGEFPVFFREECGPLAQAAIRWALRRASAVLVLTPGWRTAILAIEPTAKVTVMPNPVLCPVRDLMPVLKSRGGNILFLGRLREKKGVFDLLRAVARMSSAHAKPMVVLAGDGEIEAARSLAAELGIAEQVVLPGWVDGVLKDRLLRDADALVLPSYFEGLPICILEAMAFGVPVIATRVGGIPDTLDDGRCGFLLEPGDVDGLALGLSAVLNDLDLRRALRANARNKVEAEFAVEVVVKKLGGVYDKCLAQRRTDGLQN